ncbi:MAG: hypothetical protein NTZ05_21835 [Chloroflexi bacterium]|nr:hypothetical protein [Chloroflexota bacterium]
MFEAWRRRRADERADEDEIEAFEPLVAAALAPVAPSLEFGMALRDRLLEAAATEPVRRMLAVQHRNAVQRRVLVGAGAAAAVSLAGAALAVWRRAYPDALDGLLHAKSA